MATNQPLFEQMAETVADVMAFGANLPNVCSIQIKDSVLGTGGFRTLVALQVSSHDLSAVTAWAIEFGNTVKFRPGSDDVEVTTETVVKGHVVVVWTRTSTEAAEQLALRLGAASVDDLSAVEPARLLLGAVKDGATT